MICKKVTPFRSNKIWALFRNKFHVSKIYPMKELSVWLKFFFEVSRLSCADFLYKIENQWQLDILYFYFWKYILDLTKSENTMHPFQNPNEAASTIGVHVIWGCILIRQLFHRQIWSCYKIWVRLLNEWISSISFTFITRITIFTNCAHLAGHLIPPNITITSKPNW